MATTTPPTELSQFQKTVKVNEYWGGLDRLQQAVSSAIGQLSQPDRLAAVGMLQCLDNVTDTTKAVREVQYKCKTTKRYFAQGPSLQSCSLNLRAFLLGGQGVFALTIVHSIPTMLLELARVYQMSTPVLARLVRHRSQVLAEVNSTDRTAAKAQVLAALNMGPVHQAPVICKDLRKEAVLVSNAVINDPACARWAMKIKNRGTPNYRKHVLTARLCMVESSIIATVTCLLEGIASPTALLHDSVLMQFDDLDAERDLEVVLNNLNNELKNILPHGAMSLREIQAHDQNDLTQALEMLEMDEMMKPKQICLERLLKISEAARAIRNDDGRILIPKISANPNVYTDIMLEGGVEMDITADLWLNHCCSDSVHWGVADGTYKSIMSFLEEKNHPMFPRIFNGLDNTYAGFQDGVWNTVTTEFLPNREDGAPHLTRQGRVIRTEWFFDCAFSDLVDGVTKCPKYDRVIGVQLTNRLDYDPLSSDPAKNKVSTAEQTTIDLFNAAVFGMLVVPVNSNQQMYPVIVGLPNTGKTMIVEVLRHGARRSAITALSAGDCHNRFKWQESCETRSTCVLLDDVQSKAFPLSGQELNASVSRTLMPVQNKCKRNKSFNKHNNTDGTARDVNPLPFQVSNKPMFSPDNIGQPRRTFPFFMNTFIPDSKREMGLLQYILKNEVAAIFFKGIMLYKKLREKYGDKDWKDVFPEIKNRQRELAARANTFAQFLQCEDCIDVTNDDTDVATLEEMRKAYNAFYDEYCEPTQIKVLADDFQHWTAMDGVIYKDVAMCKVCSEPYRTNNACCNNNPTNRVVMRKRFCGVKVTPPETLQ
jgi:hypothetical protein